MEYNQNNFIQLVYNIDANYKIKPSCSQDENCLVNDYELFLPTKMVKSIEF